MAQNQRSARHPGVERAAATQPILLALLGALLLPMILAAETVGPATSESADVEPGRQLRNIHGFSKLYGFVRYFHPSDEAQQIDWQKFAVYGSRRVLQAPDVEALRIVLEELFGPLAPTLRIYPTGGMTPLAPPGPVEKKGLVAVAWQHRGPGLVPAIRDPEVWASVRLGRGDPLLDPSLLPTPEPGDEIDEPFTEGLSLTMPIALWSDAEGTLPHGDPQALAALQREVDAIDLDAWDATHPGDRVALGVLSWNVIEHFYPYFPELGVVWEQQHVIALRKLLEADDLRSTYDALRRSLWAFVGDAQAGVVHRELDAEQGWLPVAFDQVEGYITVLASEVPGLQHGDDLETFGGDRAGVVLQLEAALFGGSGQWRQAQALRNYGRGEKGSRVHIELYRRGHIYNLSAEATRSEPEAWTPEFERPPIDKLKRKNFYVDLRRATMAEIAPHLDKLAKARGVIFDLRGELAPGNHALLGYLVTEATTSSDEELPLVTWPAELDEDEGPDGWLPTTRWQIEPATPHIGRRSRGRDTRLMFLVDGRTVGEAEIFLDLVRHHQLGELVGQVTAGAAGTLHHFSLPGGFEARWTAARFRHKDGERHHLAGFEPDVSVSRGRDGAKVQRDPILDEALRRVRRR